MSDWNSELYLKFKQQRTQPVVDLINQIKGNTFYKIVDIGCGPGNSTRELKRCFPNADIIGIDNSVNMINKAKLDNPDINFLMCDANNLQGKYDLIFSNACLQWVKNHNELVPFLLEKLNSKGILAVQMPINFSEPLFMHIDDLIYSGKWNFSAVTDQPNEVLTAKDYAKILSTENVSYNIWETKYYHIMPNHTSLIDWVKGTRLRPYLDCLNENEKNQFESDLLELIRKTYSVSENGEIILGFKRLFFTAIKE